MPRRIGPSSAIHRRRPTAAIFSVSKRARPPGDGWFHSERSYGSFYRQISLPEGAIGDKAEATFKDGVLEATLDAPPREVRRGRTVEIK